MLPACIPIRTPPVVATDNARRAPELAAGIRRVKRAKSIGVRSGNWLSLKQVQALLNAPDITTARGLRDRTIIVVLLGCALAPVRGGRAHRWTLFGRIHAGGDGRRTACEYDTPEPSARWRSPATDNGLLAPEPAADIQRVKSAKSIGVRAGNWLSLKQAQTLLNAPDITTRGD